jgi:hypothetical protein
VAQDAVTEGNVVPIDTAKTRRTRKAKKEQDRFLKLLHSIMDTPAWAYIEKAGAVPLLLRMWRCYNGRNNGKIIYTHSRAMRIPGGGPHRVAKWFDALEHAGFIVATGRGSFQQKTGHMAERSTCYRLTMEPYDGEEPTRDYLNFRPEGTDE